MIRLHACRDCFLNAFNKYLLFNVMLLNANDSKITQQEMQDDSKLDNSIITIHKATILHLMAVRHVRNGMSLLKLLYDSKITSQTFETSLS